MLGKTTNASYIAKIRESWETAFASPFESSSSQIALNQRAGVTMSKSVFCLIPCAQFVEPNPAPQSNTKPCPFCSAPAIRTYRLVFIPLSVPDAYQ